MRTDSVIKQEGFNALKDKLGLVEMERFIMLINRDKFNYTEWRKDLFEDMSIHDLADAADSYSQQL